MRFEVGPVLRTLRRQPAVLAMVVAEIAAGVATLAALVLSGSWYQAIGARSSGFDEPNLIIVSTYTPGGNEAELVAAQRADLARARALPDVVAATTVTTTILDDRWVFPALFKPSAGGTAPVRAVGWPVYTDDQVGPALGLRVLAGALPAPDVAPPPAVARDAVLTRCLAEKLFGTPAAAVGRTLVSDRTSPVSVRAVVEDVLMRLPFMPHPKCSAFVMGGAPVGHEVRMMVRAAPGRRDAVLARLSGVLTAGAPRSWVEARALDSLNSNHHRIGHGLATLLSFFGALVGMIALLGALAATSFLVAQRTRQIGIRRALGATKADIVGYFLVENAFTMAFGSLIGLGGTALLFLVMERFFPGIAVKPGLLALALVAFWLATLAAMLWPAMRAARVPPSVASRSL